MIYWNTPAHFLPLEERTHRNRLVKKFNSENFSIGGLVWLIASKTCTISTLITSHRLEYMPESMHVLEIVNPSNCTKLDNLGILKQLYYLIYQCLERLKLLELSNNQGLQKFTIQELRPFLHIENIIISRFITLIHN